MNPYLFLMYIFSLSLVSCTSNTVFKKPSDLISKEQMADVLVDLYLAESIDRYSKRGSEVLAVSGVDYKIFVFHKHNIDTVRFKRSNFYYNTKIDAYLDIYKMVENKLKQIKETFKIKDSLHLENLRKSDSQTENLKKNIPDES